MVVNGTDQDLLRTLLGLSPGRTPVPDLPQHPNAGVLFTAFEPSGDAHAAPVIRQLRKLAPNLHIYAWGGPKMQEAGATLLEQSVDDAAMGLNALRKISVMRKHTKRIREWAKTYRVYAHVAVDSPAANFPICKIMRRSGSRVIHLVAPQLWAWGAWRVKKLRRNTDLVLCLLPFEEEWFTQRDIPARFIGHPRMNRSIDKEQLREEMHGLPNGAPRVSIFPGSRPQEVRANIKLLVDTYTELQGRHSGMGGVIVASDATIAQLIRKKIKIFPTGLHMVTGQVDAAIGWCDLALAVSGTITLDIARQQKPMIGVYKTGLVSWLGAKLLVRAPFLLLPNIIAEREIVPEFVPYLNGPGPVIKWASKYLLDSKNAAVQRAELGRVCQRYINKIPDEEAAQLILKIIREGFVDQDNPPQPKPAPAHG
jgi:lipid-A-disaccharide synthase